jgi:MerR family transcriptional regulator, light-induced transcriptional regulator
MTDLNPLTAGILEASASGYAAAAAVALRRRVPQSSVAADVALSSDQRAWFVQRILELAAAVRVQAPELFARRIAWLRGALLARGADDAELRDALLSLRDALEAELPQNVTDTATTTIDLALETMTRPPEPEASTLDPGDAAGRLALRYLEACLAAEPERAVDIVLRGLGNFPPKRLLTRVLAPAEREIGRLWHRGDVTVAEERLVSETTRQLLTIISYRCAAPARIGRTVLAASVSGNIHDLGLKIASDLFRLAGWRSIFLGATMPADQLARAVPMFDANLVILSATLATQLGDAAQAIEAIRHSSDTAKILVGGSAFDDAPDAWRRIKADAYAPTLEDAVATGSALVSG